MSIIQDTKQALKNTRWRARRRSAALRYGAEALRQTPIVIGNAMPKSGSHLLHQVLLGLTHIGPFVDPGMPPLTRSAQNKNLPQERVMACLAALQPGDVGYGYFQAIPEYMDALTREGFASIFIVRDPRDVLVSHVFYATDMHSGHGMHAYYQSLPDMEARINAAIEGVDKDKFQLSGTHEKYARYMPWLETEGVLCLRFEDLILKQTETLGKLLDFLQARGFTSRLSRADQVKVLAAAVQPKRSGTFRGGRVGDWHKHFTDNNRKNFKLLTEDLLQRLGYEKDANWS